MPAAHPVEVWLTGVGVVSPNGVGRAAFTDALRAGVSGLCAASEVIDTTGLKTSAVGYCRAFDPRSAMDATDVRRTPRMVPMAVAAAREAIAHAGLPVGDVDAQRSVAVLLGTGGGGLAFVERQYETLFAGGGGKLSPFAITAGTHGNLSSELSIQLGLRGPSLVVSTGCASSTDALGTALLMLRAGVVPAAVVGGADAPIAPGILNGFERMGVISTRRWDDPRRASRPFDCDRDGFVLGEGAWMFVAERADFARARGARPLATLRGYAATCDAYHRVQIAPDAAESTRAVELALRDAGAAAGDVGYVNLHGTGTKMNDPLETRALRAALGAVADRVPCSSTKSLIGHPQGACGAAGVAATVLCLRAGFAPASANVDELGDGCDLPLVRGAAAACDAKVALCNTIAFGSKNSALVIEVAAP